MGCCGSRADERFDYEAELLSNQTIRSRQVGGDRKEEMDPEAGLPRRNMNGADKLATDPFDGGLRTIWKAFQNGVSRYPNQPCLGTRMFHERNDKTIQRGNYYFLTYREVDIDVRNFGMGLVELGLSPHDNVGICAVNRAEWTMASLANFSQNFRTVALYDTLGENAISYILNHAEIKLAVVSKEKIQQVLNVLGECKTMKYIIQMDSDPRYGNYNGDNIDEKHVKKAQEFGVKILAFSEVVRLGSNSEKGIHEPKPDDLAFIMYTSGTTGEPKGAMLQHQNVMACVAGGLIAGFAVNENDRYLSYLTLAHIFETISQTALLLVGAAIGFYQGTPKKIVDDCKELKPTLFAGVPRVYSRFYETIMGKVSELNCIKRSVFQNAYNDQCQRIRRGQPISKSHDSIFMKVRAGIGLDECRWMVTGAAPMPPYVMEFLKVVINPPMGVFQGYGLTETCAAGTMTEGNDHLMGHVGSPNPSVEVRLKDVPEMGYLHKDQPCPRGEIQIRGPAVFVGYYKNEAATAAAMDKDGWFMTGDIGRWNPNGTLSIIDRRKNIFKLAQGEYVAAEKIEMVYAQGNLISQVFVYGNSYKTFLVAVVVPNAEKWVAIGKERGWWNSDATHWSEQMRIDFSFMVKMHGEEMKKDIMKQLDELANGAKLSGFEKVKGIHLEGELDDTLQGFNVANECMTPSFKLRRPYLVKRYKQYIMDLYSLLGEPPKGDEKW